MQSRRRITTNGRITLPYSDCLKSPRRISAIDQTNDPRFCVFSFGLVKSSPYRGIVPHRGTITLDCWWCNVVSVEIGSFNMLRILGRASLLIQTFLAFEDALQRYKRSFPARAYA